jgi:hypothetical protein
MRPERVALCCLYATEADIGPATPRFQCPKATQFVFARNSLFLVSRVLCIIMSVPSQVMLCAGSRGVSVIFSSGDGGVGDGNPNPKTQQCFTNNGQNQTQFIPHFPSSCPLCVFIILYLFSLFPSMVCTRPVLQRYYSGWDVPDS